MTTETATEERVTLTIVQDEATRLDEPCVYTEHGYLLSLAQFRKASHGSIQLIAWPRRRRAKAGAP